MKRRIASWLGAWALLWASSALGAPPPPKAPERPTAAIVQKTDGGGVHFDVHKKESVTLFDAAATKFKGSLDTPKLRLQLKGIADGKRVTQPQLDELKLVRKDGNILRSTFVIFDKKHEAPPKLDAYVTRFGKMNDALAAGDQKMGAHYARKVLKALDEKGMKKEVSGFQPASGRSFEKHIDEETKNLEASLERKTLRAPEFHEMRKSLTKVLAILTLTPDARNDPAIYKLYNKVLTLQTDMGLLHDELTAKALRGEIDYEKHELAIPAKMRTELREILDTLE